MELSRRGFLGGLAALGVAGCAGRPPRRLPDGGFDEPSYERGHRLRDGRTAAAAGAGTSVDVVILGAGVAGLSAAWTLARAGFEDFRVLELERDPGGTARAGAGPVSAYPWGAHYVPVPTRGNAALTAVLQEVGAITSHDAAGRPVYAEDVLVREPAERVFFRGEWFEGLYPGFGADADERRQLEAFELEMARRAGQRDAAGRRAFTLPRARGSDEAELRALDGLSMADYLDRQGWTAPRLRWLVDYSCRDDFGVAADGTSAWAGLHYFCARHDPEDEQAGEYLTWPEGNGRIVSHLAGVCGERLELGALALSVEPEGDRVRIGYEDAGGAPRALQARHVVFALPRFLAAPLIAPWREDPPAWLRETVYGSWVVANLTLSGRPAGRGFQLAWDNVLYDSDSLGYVVATHQTGSDHGATVLTWYRPLPDGDPRAVRERLLASTWEEWVAAVLDDLRPAHPDIDALVERIDVCRWGHAMVRPRPAFLWSEALERSARPLGRIHFAHTDLSGMALFEEAQYHGVRAAEAILRERGHRFRAAS